jgi:predicted permease
MPDWLSYVRQHLDVSNLTPAREAEIVEDLARQLEDLYTEALARGETEDAAAAAARGQITDWDSFACDLYRTNRQCLQSALTGWTEAAEAAATAPAGRSRALTRMTSGLALDLAQALRALWKQPAFTVVVVATLALGVGANTAIFTLLDQVMLRALPVENPQALVLFGYRGPNSGRVMNDGTHAFSYPMYKDLRDRNPELVAVLARFQTAVTLLHGTRAERVQAELVSGNYFAVLGLGPAIGRLLAAADDVVPGGHPVVVLSHGLWIRRFGGDHGIVGRTVRLNGHPMTVVGVAPAGFAGTQVGAPPDLYVPIAMKAAMTPTWDELNRRRAQWLELMGRLRPGVSREQAEAAARVVFRQAREQEVKELTTASASRRKRFVETPLSLEPGARGLSPLRAQFSTPLVLLMGMVGLVLLIACANVANLLMARAPARQREVAIRLALGASAGRIVRRLLVESLLLALAGGVAGIVLAMWTGGLLLGVLPGDGARAFTTAPDGRVLGFAALVSFATSLLFGLVPALQAARPQLVDALKEDGGRVVPGGHARLRKGLVVAQVALSLLLLVGAGLFARSLWNLRALDPGFDTTGVVTFSVDPTLSGYDATRTAAFYRQLQEQLQRTPGVTAASPAAVAPLTDNLMISTVKVEGYQPKDGEDMNPHVNSVGPGYFQTLEMALVAGRDFTERDGADAPNVAIISEKMARVFFGNANPIGRRIGFVQTAPPTIEIVGVVRDSKDNLLRDDIARVVYTPYPQGSELSQMTFFVRLSQGVSADLVRRAVERTGPAIPVFDLKSMEAQKSDSLFVDRMVAMLSMAFGAVATLLAAVGIYGVVSYTVARRTREIGLRVALGAPRGRVLWLVMREVVALTAIGACIGVMVALAASRLVASQLFSLSPTDPLTLVGAAVMLVGVALFAGYVPASRAARVDPLQALRHG